MRIISWNVNGIRAILKKNFKEFVKNEEPDILCLQETKAHPDQVDKILTEYEHHFWNAAEKKGYSGTAVFSKIKPIKVIYGDGPMNDNEGRVITLEFDKFYLVNVYTPNAQPELKRIKFRNEWDKNFLKFLKDLEKKKPVVVCGDFNVAHKEIDLAHPKANENSAGFSPTERKGMDNYINSGFIDTFREFNKEPKNYTWWTYRFGARSRNVGWRIDYFLISKKLRHNLKSASILSKVMGSDHCPIELELE